MLIQQSHEQVDVLLKQQVFSIFVRCPKDAASDQGSTGSSFTYCAPYALMSTRVVLGGSFDE